jgi:hypothetical protein
MRRILFALILVLSFAVPIAAHADSYQYTLVWNFPHVGDADTSAYIGTYSFTVDSLINGRAAVYGPGFDDTVYPFYPYIYAADFTVPPNSKVSSIVVGYFLPDNTLGTGFGFVLNQKNGGGVSTGVYQDPNDPNYFF